MNFCRVLKLLNRTFVDFNVEVWYNKKYQNRKTAGGKMNKSESKFNNTAIKMDTALFRLLDTKDFQDITITDICQKAGVNRSTFYAHYANTLDLLEETEKRIMSDFFKNFQSELAVENIDDLSIDDSIFISTKYLLPYLEFVKENKKLFTIYMKHLKVFKSNDVFQALLQNVFVPVLRKYKIHDEVLVSYFAKYYLTGINAITMHWLERDCVDDIHLICEIIMLCTNQHISP